VSTLNESDTVEPNGLGVGKPGQTLEPAGSVTLPASR
jgi:hypothetical protein